MDLETFGEYIVEDVVLKQPYSFMASDQKGPNIILSFSQQCSHCISQQFVNISLENKDRVLEAICKYDRLSIPRLVLVVLTLFLARRIRRREKLILELKEYLCLEANTVNS